ncbi:hypothetical protein [Flavobacterium sp. CF136]|uniref:hypothetical protein n=1 Tax=Flavobacterium sp. (strain CF136) TaxID=1144313 RepID=UPI0012FBE984|nr:hypothetical protein [Flavobacterium sp. CF136]
MSDSRIYSSSLMKRWSIMAFFKFITVSFALFGFTWVYNLCSYEYAAYYYSEGFNQNSLDDTAYGKQKIIRLQDTILQRYAGIFVLDTDPSQRIVISLKNNRLSIVNNDWNKIILPGSETLFFENSQVQNSYNFVLNPKTKSYDLIITCAGIKFKMRKLQ